MSRRDRRRQFDLRTTTPIPVPAASMPPVRAVPVEVVQLPPEVQNAIVMSGIESFLNVSGVAKYLNRK